MARGSGARLGPYELIAPLGAGGMGQVWRAHDARFRRDVAIKFIAAELAHDPEWRARFEREARAAGALNHPNILTVHDLGEDDAGRPYLVTELLEGETLRDVLRPGPLPVKKALDDAIQLAEGLAAAHAAGIVHRDLKPENVFVTREGRVKILDFGLAHRAREQDGGSAIQTATGFTSGTPGYMAPEQVRGARDVDARADLFAYGCVVYEMLAGSPPFGQGLEAFHHILHDDPMPLRERRPEVPGSVDALVNGCLEKDRERRLRSAWDIARLLERTSAVAVIARGERSRTPMIAATALAGAALGAFTWATAMREPATPSPAVFHRLTYTRGTVDNARFGPDGQTLVYSAAWRGQPPELFSGRADSRESRPFGFGDAQLFAVSAGGEIAMVLHHLAPGGFGRTSTFAQAPMAGGAPREQMEGVDAADIGVRGVAVVRGGALELPVGHVIHRTDGWIGDVRCSRDGRWIAITEHPNPGYLTGTLVILDVNGRERARSKRWNRVAGIAWAPRRSEVWFTSSDSGAGSALCGMSTAGAERILQRFPVRMALQDVSPEGRLLITQVQEQWEMRRTDATGGEQDLSWYDMSDPAAISADGRTLVFTEHGEGAGLSASVYIRGTDGSPAARLGDGYALALSSDGHSVLARSWDRRRLFAVPTGAGRAVTLNTDSLQGIDDLGAWLPDNRHAMIFAYDRSGHEHPFIADVAGEPPRLVPIAGSMWEGNLAWELAPDGQWCVQLDTLRRVIMTPLDGRPSRPTRAIVSRGETPIEVGEDGRSVFVNHWMNAEGYPLWPAEVVRIDLDSGQRTLVRRLMPPDVAGVGFVFLPTMTRNGRTIVYHFWRRLSDLYVSDPIR